VQISDNPDLFQPLVEENIRAANAGQIINDLVWGERVCLALSPPCMGVIQDCSMQAEHVQVA
jgi:hypothetical protein